MGKHSNFTGQLKDNLSIVEGAVSEQVIRG